MDPEPSDQAPDVRHESAYEAQVDGETFIVRQRTDEPGTYDFDWVSGPNEGYGFGSSWSGQERTHDHLDQDIRGFLTMIDPATGFIADD